MRRQSVLTRARVRERLAGYQRKGYASGNGNSREVSKVIVSGTARVKNISHIVVVSCGAVNSAALLLRSANDSHPNGLANGSDVVGRHYMGHINSVLMALSKCPNPTVFQKTLAINDFYFGRRIGTIRWATFPSLANWMLTH